MKKVLIFGVFDNFHEGHRSFLKQAMAIVSTETPSGTSPLGGGRGGGLIIVVARDSTVQHLKNKEPKWRELKRQEIVQRFVPGATVVLGDEARGSYEVVKTHRPDMICLGYDQKELGEDLRAKIASGALPPIELIMLNPHEPELYKSSRMV